MKMLDAKFELYTMVHERMEFEKHRVDHSRQMPVERVIRLFEKAGVIGRMEVKQDVGITPLPNESPVIFVADLPERVARQAFVDSRHALRDMASRVPQLLKLLARAPQWYDDPLDVYGERACTGCWMERSGCRCPRHGWPQEHARRLRQAPPRPRSTALV